MTSHLSVQGFGGFLWCSLQHTSEMFGIISLTQSQFEVVKLSVKEAGIVVRERLMFAQMLLATLRVFYGYVLNLHIEGAPFHACGVLRPKCQNYDARLLLCSWTPPHISNSIRACICVSNL